MTTSEFIKKYPHLEKVFKAVLRKQDIELIDIMMNEYAKQQSILFASFIDGKGFVCDLHTDDDEKIWSRYDEKEHYTTKELYELFLKTVK